MWLHIDTALNREDRRNSGGNQNSLSATEEGRAEGLNRERQAAEVSTRRESFHHPACGAGALQQGALALCPSLCV